MGVTFKRSHLLALGLCTGLYAASFVAARVTPAHRNLVAQVEGMFTEGGGWFPGEPLNTAQPVRAWGSWCGTDENTGTLLLGPFPSPTSLQIGVGGYPNENGIQIYAEHGATKERVNIASAPVGEKWRIVEHRLPAAWTGQPISLVAIDRARQVYGWIAITEPLNGGMSTAAVLLRSFAGGTFLLVGLHSFFAVLFRDRIRLSATTVARSGAPMDTWPRAGRLLPWFLGAGALMPFWWCRASFADVWWFGDEWDQLDQIARQGFWRWTVHPFGENVVPLFKTAWGTLALWSGGNYYPLLAAVWLTHALNTALLARLMRAGGFGCAGMSLASVIFGLTVANAEILGWSIQWSNVLAVLFLLIAVDWFVRHPPRGDTDWRNSSILALCSAASALSFVRGVLTGIVLALGTTLFVGCMGSVIRFRWRTAILCLIPPAVVIGWMFLSAPGNHHELARDGFGRRAIEFGAWFWAMVPFHRLLEIGTWNGQTALVLGALKTSLIAFGLYRARGIQRQILFLLLLFDLGNAALLGIGRYTTGLQFANSSRYYYSSLVCVVPFIGVAFDAWLAPVRSVGWRAVFATLLVAAAALRVARGWPHEAQTFAEWRGRNTRQVLLHDAHPPAEGAVPGIPFLRTERAKELIEIYHLH